MQVSVSSGEYNIIYNGYTFLFGKEENLRVDILADHDFHFSVVLEFLKDDSATERSIEKTVNGNTITFSCKNFEDNGAGLASPENIAVINGKELYLMFWSYVEGNEKNRSVKYTIFCQK